MRFTALSVSFTGFGGLAFGFVYHFGVQGGSPYCGM